MAHKRAGGRQVPDNPFSEDHYALCNSMLECHQQASALYQKLAAAGFNTADMQAEIDHYAGLAAGVKQQFFPNRK